MRPALRPQSAPPPLAESPSVGRVTALDLSRYSSYSRLVFEAHDNGVLLITLSNPDKLNATDAGMHDELSRVFRDIDRDPAVRAVVVTGAGKAFSAGGYLQWIKEQVGYYTQTM